jgi:hypothetical protein
MEIQNQKKGNSLRLGKFHPHFRMQIYKIYIHDSILVWLSEHIGQKNLKLIF